MGRVKIKIINYHNTYSTTGEEPKNKEPDIRIVEARGASQKKGP